MRVLRVVQSRSTALTPPTPLHSAPQSRRFAWGFDRLRVDSFVALELNDVLGHHLLLTRYRRNGRNRL